MYPNIFGKYLTFAESPSFLSPKKLNSGEQEGITYKATRWLIYFLKSGLLALCYDMIVHYNQIREKLDHFLDSGYVEKCPDYSIRRSLGTSRFHNRVKVTRLVFVINLRSSYKTVIIRYK